MNPCQVCGEAFDVHEPAAGTRADATPSPGSLLVCGGCGALYQIGQGLEPERIELEQLADIADDQRVAIAEAQERIRERAARLPPPGYVAGIERVERLARGWLDRNRKGERPRLRMADGSMFVIAPLGAIAGRIAANTRARDLLAYLLRMEPDLTVFMLRVAALRIGLPIETVSLSELGFDVPKS